MKNYDTKQPSVYILYLDANNLYGWAMSQSLPTGEFKWLSQEELTNLYVISIPDDAETGYFLEVDLEYPKELHDLHSDYPLAPEKLLVTNEMTSNYSKQLATKFNLGTSKVPKLVPNLMNKTNYVLHYRNLKQYLQLGLKLTNIHRVLSFKQSKWMKPFIDFNTEKRKEAKNEFEKDFFKLMNNAVFGKTMENVRKRVNVKIVNDLNRRNKLVSKPTFKSMKIFDENLAAIHMMKGKIVLDKPVYIGFSVLDLSKTLMYDFHYNFIKKTYDDNAKLLFTDTDSLCYEVRTDDVYQDI